MEYIQIIVTYMYKKLLRSAVLQTQIEFFSIRVELEAAFQQVLNYLISFIGKLTKIKYILLVL